MKTIFWISDKIFQSQLQCFHHDPHHWTLKFFVKEVQLYSKAFIGFISRTVQLRNSNLEQSRNFELSFQSYCNYCYEKFEISYKTIFWLHHYILLWLTCLILLPGLSTFCIHEFVVSKFVILHLFSYLANKSWQHLEEKSLLLVNIIQMRLKARKLGNKGFHVFLFKIA